MLKIGDFSRLSRTTVKTLRYYDDMGLLHPVYIDPYTGYRYYALEQLPRLNRILAFKDLGLSLEQIQKVLDEALPPAQLRGMLRLKQAEIQSRLQDEQERLARVEARLRQIEQEDKMPDYEIVLKTVEPLQVASVTGVIQSYETSEPVFDRLFDEVYEYVHRQGVRAGCGIALYLQSELEQGVEVEALAPIYGRLKSDQRVRVYELPGEQVASVVHHGPFATIVEAYRAILGWIEASGYTITGPTRELYLQYQRGGDQNQYVTEVQFPVVKRSKG